MYDLGIWGLRFCRVVQSLFCSIRKSNFWARPLNYQSITIVEQLTPAPVKLTKLNMQKLAAIIRQRLWEKKPRVPSFGLSSFKSFSVPVDCLWSGYSDWSQCSATCGVGTQTRHACDPRLTWLGRGMTWICFFLAMSRQRQNSRKGGFGSSNARVSGREFRCSWRGLFFIDTVEETDRLAQLIF